MNIIGGARTSISEFGNSRNGAQCSVMKADEHVRRLALSNHPKLSDLGFCANISASQNRTTGV